MSQGRCFHRTQATSKPKGEIEAADALWVSRRTLQTLLDSTAFGDEIRADFRNASRVTRRRYAASAPGRNRVLDARISFCPYRQMAGKNNHVVRPCYSCSGFAFPVAFVEENEYNTRPAISLSPVAHSSARSVPGVCDHGSVC